MCKQILRHVLPVILLLITLTPAASTTFAESTSAILRPDPLSLGLKPGENGTITIRANDVQNMYGIEFHLTFNPNIVEVVDADTAKPGVQITSGDWLKNNFVAVNKADNSAGKIDYGVTLLNPAPPVSGNGVVATITFKAKGNGTSPLKIEKAILASRDGKEIKSVWQDGAIGVSALGQAPNVKETTRSSESPAVPTESIESSFPLRAVVLIGVAGIGMFVFLGALVLVGVLLLRRK